MSDLGSFLKEHRNRCHLSLKDVHDQTGITDSKLSRVERGEGKPLDPDELKKLAHLYGVGVVSLFILAGYLEEQDLSDYQFVFKDADLLSEEEKENVQTQINLFTKGRKVSNNDF